MLRLILGLNSSQKLKYCAEKMKGDISAGKNVLAVVPDQFSFAYDKSLYKELGARDFNTVTVLSFKRLSEMLISRCGTSDGTLAGPGERMILISLALKRVKSEKSVSVLSRSLDRPGFCEEFARIADSFRRSGITPENVSEAAGRVGGTLRDKLNDIAVIYGAYTEILRERSLRDESSVISEGAAIASQKSAFKGVSVYIDRFDSFSPDELKLLSCAVRDAESVSVCLHMPKNYRKSAISPFSHCEATQNAVIALAEQFLKKVDYVFCDSETTSYPAISGAGLCLFAPVKKVPESGGVKIVRADTVYEEADFVAAQIRRLVTREGFCFNDIAVITHDMDSYGPVLEASFARYGVEAFIDSPQSASEMSLALYALDAVEAAATRKPDTEKIMKYLRSPFSPLTQEEFSLLWDYSVRWSVDGEIWLSDFTAGEPAELEALNLARVKAIEPLKKLHDASALATAKEISSAFCDFLRETGLADRAYSVIEDCEDAALKLETARLYRQLWNAVMLAVTQIYLTAADEKLTLRSFGELLRLTLSQSSVSTPPQKLDSVTVADVSRSVIDSPRAVFIVGLADGLFPAEIRTTGLFSGRDIAALEEIGLMFDITPEARLSSERFDCYKAFASPSERLYLSWSGSDLRGRQLSPSRFISKIRSFCGAEPVMARTLGAEFYCSTPEAAYYHLAVSKDLSGPEKASVAAALCEIPGYREKLGRLENSGGAHRLSPEASKKLFASNGINITASRIDVYNRCPYEYFCKYGLKLEPVKPVIIDPANRGTVMHYLFENVLRHFGESFSEASDEDIDGLVSKLLDGFSDENFGGDFAKTAKFRADYRRLGGAAIEILKNMREEFKVSKFRPVRFEYDLSDENGRSALTIPLGGGVSLNIRGVVDRVDTYSGSDGKNYIRVIDYKTGKKEFAFEDIYNGLNLQLLLYMLALTEGRDAGFKDFIPSGILYMRAGFLECKDGFDPLGPDNKTRLQKTAEQLKRNGLIVGLDEPMEAMDCTFSGSYAPVKKNKNGSLSEYSRTVSPKSFSLLEDFAKRKAVRFGHDLLEGRIEALPTGDDPEHLQCAFCDYGSVCDRRKYMMKLIKKSDGEKLADEIMAKEADGDV